MFLQKKSKKNTYWILIYQDWSTVWRDPCWGWSCPRSCRTISRFQRNRGCHQYPWSPWLSWKWDTCHPWKCSSCPYLSHLHKGLQWCYWWGSSCRHEWGHQCKRHRLCRHPWSHRPQKRTWFLKWKELKFVSFKISLIYHMIVLECLWSRENILPALNIWSNISIFVERG